MKKITKPEMSIKMIRGKAFSKHLGSILKKISETKQDDKL